jgi:hypothetical protein
MISNIFVLGFVILLTITMEMTWPTKARSFVDGRECATELASAEHVKSLSVLEDESDAETN